MKNIKEEVMDTIIIGMYKHVNKETMDVLRAVLIASFQDVTISRNETLPAEIHEESEVINRNVLDLYMAKAPAKDSSKKQYVRAMNKMLDMVNKVIFEVTTMDVEYYLNSYLAAGNSVVSYNNERRFISAIFGWMENQDMITKNPVRKIASKKEIQKPIEYLSPEEMEVLRLGCRDLRDRALIEFLYSTGARVGELPYINRSDIDFRNGSLMLYGEKDSEYREVYITEQAKVHLIYYLQSRKDNNPSLFVHQKSTDGKVKTLKKCGIRETIKRIGKRSEVHRRIYPHLLRHTMATTLRNKDVDIADIQQMLGHKCSTTTTRYYAASSKGRSKYIHNRAMAA